MSGFLFRIRLTETEIDALAEAAKMNLRSPSDQARLIIQSELVMLGLLNPKKLSQFFTEQDLNRSEIQE